MGSERWGTFSVIDHKNGAAMAPEVLLYHRLVLPYPSTPDERKRWADSGWEPGLLDDRIDALGNLAMKGSWDQNSQKTYQSWMEKLKAVQFDANQMTEEAKQKLPYAVTRVVLAQQTDPLPPGVTRVVRVAAYQSEADLQSHFHLGAKPGEKEAETLGYLLAHRIAVPAHVDPETAFKKAVKLAKEDEKFQEHRQKLYEWQETVLRDKIPPAVAVTEMDQKVERYNKAVEKAVKDVYYKFAFTLAGAGLAIAAGGLFSPFATGGALLAVVRFAKYDMKPAVDAGDNAPAAMFHDIEATYKKFRLA